MNFLVFLAEFSRVDFIVVDGSLSFDVWGSLISLPNAIALMSILVSQLVVDQKRGNVVASKVLAMVIFSSF